MRSHYYIKLTTYDKRKFVHVFDQYAILSRWAAQLSRRSVGSVLGLPRADPGPDDRFDRYLVTMHDALYREPRSPCLARTHQDIPCYASNLRCSSHFSYSVKTSSA